MKKIKLYNDDTLIRMDKLIKKGIGIELDEKYFNIAKERVRNEKIHS